MGIVANQPRWAIVGGGMLGMTLAHRLAQRGNLVCLYEAADHLGGLASAWQLGDVVWDRHYHVTLMSDAHTRALLAELDLDSEIEWVETRTGFFVDGQMHSMSNSWEFLRFPPLGLISKLRLALTIMYAARIRDWRRLERIGVADWLRRWSGRRTFEKIWLPLLRAKLGENYRRTSAAFIWATIARMYAARRSGLKKEMFGYVPGGYARILARFAERLTAEGVDLRLSTPVSGVEQAGEQVVVVSERQGTPCVEQFDLVVLTVPAPQAARMCAQLTNGEKERLRRIEYQGILCASLLLKRPLSPYYVTNITDSEVPFTAVIEMGALVDRRHFGGGSLVYLPKYLPENDAAFGQSDERLRDMFVAGLKRMYPDLKEDEILAFRISRVRRVVALSTLDYSRDLPGLDTTLPGTHIASSFQIVNGTLNVNETVGLAEQAAREIDQRHGARRAARGGHGASPAAGECLAGSR